ncbi:MAG: M90 family metallopeptidase [Bacteroidia bacterium]
MQLLFFILPLLLATLIAYNIKKKKKNLLQISTDVERKILQEYVLFYKKLTDAEKINFEERILNFLQKVSITGVETTIDDIDRVFVAAAAIIPIFKFKDWEYRNIHEVLIYPNSFTKNYGTDGAGRDILGMVGEGAMQNLMIISKQDLHDGFLNTQTQTNVAIHEFVHLVDKEDGYTDGNPENLLIHKYSVPWLQQIHKEIALIQKGKSDINPYGATNEAEFLAVASEYFFKQPDLMEHKHPELFNLLKQIFGK